MTSGLTISQAAAFAGVDTGYRFLLVAPDSAGNATAPLVTGTDESA